MLLRVIYYLVFSIVLFGCTDKDKPIDKDKLLGNDFRLFQGTPVWELAKAVWDEDTDRIRELVQQEKVNIDFQEERFGQTLLMLAVKNAYYTSTKTLLELGAKPNLHDQSDGSTALMDAAKLRSNIDIMKVLLDYGANPNAIEVGARKEGNTRRDTPLIAASRHSLDKVKMLLKHGAKINYKNEFGTTALNTAFLLDQYDNVLFLLNNGADYTVPILDRDGKNYYLIDILRELTFSIGSSEYNQKMNIVKFLESKGVDYRSRPIPDFVVEEAKKTYPESWKKFLEKY